MKKFLTLIFFALITSTVFSEVRFGLNVGDKFYIQDSPENYLTITTGVAFSTFKSLEIIAEYEFANHTQPDYTIWNGTFALGIQYGFDLKNSFYIRPGVLIGLFGFSYCHRVSPLYDDLQIDSEIGGPYVELKVEAAKRFALQKKLS